MSNIQAGVAKAKAGLRAPEDEQNKAPSVADAAAFDRAQRIVNNDLENIACVIVCGCADAVSAPTLPLA